jgi:hypothetical protein
MIAAGKRDGRIGQVGMRKRNTTYKVFISHASDDTWVAKQIATHLEQCGASYFLDVADIQHGDEFEEQIRQALRTADEMLLLLTPWAITRSYIWMETGVFWERQKRIVVVLYGVTSKDFLKDPRVPHFLKKKDFVLINEIDTYFAQLEARVKAKRGENGRKKT